MGDSHKVAAVFLAAMLATAGCASVTNYLDRPFREPGERLKTFPEKVWSEYDCDRQKLPYFEIERLELFPKRITPGGQLKHRMVYVLCPSRPTGVVAGTLARSIMYRGNAIVRGQEAHDLKPGRWVVDVFLDLPETAQVGVYALNIQFESPQIRFDRALTFAVDAADD